MERGAMQKRRKGGGGRKREGCNTEIDLLRCEHLQLGL